MNVITVFTPTYNRGYKLSDLYRSMQRQTCKDFEWVIVDDGSQDDTSLIVEMWMKESNAFNIKYCRQENKGKHAAINVGVTMSSCEWFFIVDSDDYLVDDAIERSIKWINTIDNDRIIGVSGNRKTPDGGIIGTRWGQDEETYIDAKNNERERYGLGGDKAEIYMTAMLRKFPFKYFEGERFLSEASVWDLFAINGYCIRWFNYATVVCQYLDDGLTNKVNNTDLELKNFNGYTYTTTVRLKAYSGFVRYRIICQYINKAKRKNISNREISVMLGEPRLLISMASVAIWLKKILMKK